MHATQVLDTHLRRLCQGMHSYRLNGVIDCVFRPNPITHSGANRSLIPVQTDH